MIAATTTRRDPIAWFGAGVAALVLILAPGAEAQEGKFEQTAASARSDYEKAQRELNELRDRIAKERSPLNQQLRDVEKQVSELRRTSEEQQRLLDSRNLDLNTLRGDTKSRRDERAYLSTLLDEYIRNFGSRVHITELGRYQDTVDAATLAPDNSNLTPAEVYGKQVDLVDASLDRLLDVVGGTTFQGTAAEDGGSVKDVDFALIGPLAMYSATDGSSIGIAEPVMNSLEPRMYPAEDPAQAAALKQLFSQGQGDMLADVTLGNARAVAEVEGDDTTLAQIKKGGLVMFPILALAGAAFLVALIKLGQLLLVPKASPAGVQKLLDAVKRRDFPAAKKLATGLKGPAGDMLRAGVDHLHEPKELVEEVMFEKSLDAKLRLQSFLPFIAVAAAAAPLMGLLGTVTGIINTFKMITIFGTGDAKTLSGGISEALITTKFGLVVAIPSLLAHALLTRMAKRILDRMEKGAVQFLNRIPPTPTEQFDLGQDHPEAQQGAGVSAAGHRTSALPGVTPSIKPTDGPDH